MRLLYLAFANTSYEQIISKINQQFKAIKKINADSNCYVVGVNNANISLNRYEDINYIDLKKTVSPSPFEEYYNKWI